MKNLILILAIIFGSSTSSIGQLRNTILGDSSGTSITTGGRNSFVGYGAGQNTNSGSDNTFLGNLSGNSNSTGYNNVCIGSRSGEFSTTGNFNTFVGPHAGSYNRTGSMNSTLGHGAGGFNQSGSNNTCIGFLSGLANINGSGNVFLGNWAGAIETGSNKLYIANDQNNHLIYGDFSTNQIGINTKDLDTHTFSVNGTALAKEIIVKIGWGDYVFHNDYQLPTLAQEAQHIEENGHLSGFQSAEEMNGEIQLGDVTKRQQVKLEEMMLHIIELNEERKKHHQEIIELKAQINSFRSN